MIHVVVGNYNKTELTERCVASLDKHTDTKIEVVQVDNGCKKTKRFTEHYLKYKEPLGFTRAYNEGIRYIRKTFPAWKYVLLINNDVEVKPGWLEPLMVAMKSSEKVAMVAPLIIDDVNKHVGIPAHSDIVGGHIFAYREEEEKKGIMDALSLNFTCVLVNRSFVDDHGLMDESMVTFCSDLDYSLRATQAGWRCRIAKESLVWHGLNQTVNDLPDREKIKQSDQIIFLTKWSGLYLNDVLKEIPLDKKRNAHARVTFLIADEDGTIINWGTGENIRQEESRVQTENVREQFESLKRLRVDQ